MRAQGLVLEDPEVTDYIQQLGHSLSSHAEEGQHQFNYAVVRDPVINAFAMPGGFIMINSGLFLVTTNENELAGVLAHETAHVTQRHLVRGMIDQTHAGLLATAAMLAAIVLGATAGRGDPSVMEGAILGAQSAAIQHQINYTRTQEFEADRIGIGTMAAAGYDPLGMATMFTELERNSPNPDRVKAIEFLIDHPLSAERIAEARNRAEQIGRIRHEDSLSYLLMRERLRSLVGNPEVAREYYANLAKNSGGLDLEQRYGKAVADIAARKPALAIPDLQALLLEYPRVTQFYGALGQAYLGQRPAEGVAGGAGEGPRAVPAQRAGHYPPRGDLDAGRRQQARPAHSRRPVQPGGAHAESGEAHREGCQRCRQHRGFLLLHGGLLPHERRPHARRRINWRSPWGSPT